MDVKGIIKEAGFWAEPLHQALNFITIHATKEGLEYQLQMNRIENILRHFKTFKPKEIYEFYKNVYDKIKLS